MASALVSYKEMIPCIDYNGTKFPSYWTSVERLDSLETKDDFKPDDVIVSSFPKTGTHWMMCIVHLIKNADNLEIAMETLYSSLKTLECIMTGDWDEITPPEKIKHPERHFYYSHLPYHLLPAVVRDGNCKIIYIARNPKDTFVSFYNFHLTMNFLNYSAPWNDFFEVVMANDGKEMAFGSIVDHTLSYWKHASEENRLFLKYEDVKMDTTGGVRKVANFLGQTLTDDQVAEIVALSSIDAMKSNKTLTDLRGAQDLEKAKQRGMAGVFRKGIVGDWKNYFTVAQAKRFDSWYAKKMEGSGLEFVC